ncbi:hypothetical protein VQ056_21550 [Paenibacillus sp. JTLBN-2024]
MPNQTDKPDKLMTAAAKAGGTVRSEADDRSLLYGPAVELELKKSEKSNGSAQENDKYKAAMALQVAGTPI